MDAVEAIKQRLSIEDVVGDYVQLRRMGANMKGLCPFHNEKTPSFTVSVEKGIYHCFGCSEGGDMFEFIMKVEGLDFKEALSKLAAKAGINLEDFGQKKSKSVTRLIDISGWAAKFYQVNLTVNKKAIDYVVKTRKMSKDVIEDFKIGYAPKNGTALWEFLEKRGVSQEDALAAGLIKKNNRGVYDVFRGRVTIALSDQSGRTIGFTARALDDQQPKYLNTSSTAIYDKGSNVFAWHLAKDSIRKNDLAVLVEGNMDVIASHAVGVKNVVATAGTALTTRQLKVISRITKNIALSFDSDSAGVAATIRAIPLAQSLDINLSVIDCSPYKDPDEMIQKDVVLWQQAITSKRPVFDWLIDYYKKTYDLKTGGGKKAFSDSIIPVIKEIKNPIEQDHYASAIAEVLDVSKDAVLRSFDNENVTSKSTPKKQSAYKIDKIEEDRQLENTILGLATAFPDLVEELKQVDEDNFSFPESRSLYRKLCFDEKLNTDDNYATIVEFRAEELFGQWTEHERLLELKSLLTRLLQNAKKKQQNELTNQIRKAEESGDMELTKHLLEKYQATVLGISKEGE